MTEIYRYALAKVQYPNIKAINLPPSSAVIFKFQYRSFPAPAASNKAWNRNSISGFHYFTELTRLMAVDYML